MDLSIIDVERLRKGDVIPTAKLERASGLSRHDRAYPMALLQVREAVERHFRDVRREVVTVACRGDALHVLTDAEAAEYNADAFEQGIRRARLAFRRCKGVDQANLSAEDRLEHMRNLECMALRLAAERRARRKAAERLTVAAAAEE